MPLPSMSSPPFKTRSDRRRILRTGAAGVLGLMAATPMVGCSGFRNLDPVVPMEITRVAGAPGAQTLVAMLPGAFSRPRDFIDEGFIDLLRSAGWGHDVALVDAHLGYVTNRTVLQRLQTDLLKPARQQGYRRIWLLGISLGGFVALLQALEDPSGIDGVVALAPYLGPRRVYAPWLKMSGPERLAAMSSNPTDETLDPEDAAVTALWSRHAQRQVDAPVWIGWGLKDRFAQANAALSASWPTQHRMTAPGDHDWPAWRDLWRQWLQHQAQAAWSR